ncbi:acyl carrier protein [Bacteroides xylanisolvens]|uniref:Acyl carrier protein n=1 Tax=Bacteroides xylanisolvens TaxID=371601 RepID=A0A415HFS8_9BACE|nr:phosphopantetheine-binding protein [Bacteroides xylanisolvens]RHK91525.1 acyl carrier protein [Bacteroides xylanisolvens]
MELTEIYKQLEIILIEITGDETLHVDENTTTDEISGWSSLVQTHLIVKVEHYFNCRLTLRDIMLIKKNISTIANLIAEKIK